MQADIDFFEASNTEGTLTETVQLEGSTNQRVERSYEKFNQIINKDHTSQKQGKKENRKEKEEGGERDRQNVSTVKV